MAGHRREGERPPVQVTLTLILALTLTLALTRTLALTLTLTLTLLSRPRGRAKQADRRTNPLRPHTHTGDTRVRTQRSD